jgi:hypothetical protein
VKRTVKDNICNIIREIDNELDETASGLDLMMSPALALSFGFYCQSHTSRLGNK